MAKIAKGERNDKPKTQFSGLAWPSRLLAYEKIVKGERNDKPKTQFSGLAWSSRLPAYEKIVKGERKAKMRSLGVALSGCINFQTKRQQKGLRRIKYV